MCGIAGFVDFVNKEADGRVLKQMTDAIAHRGPDDEGHYIKGNVALGHRRLAIIDLTPAGHQPMFSHDGRFVIVLNGEIYNYIELKNGLMDDGVQFRTATDTEVVLEMYRKHGPDCVSYFNGMWAFVLYDLTDGDIFISRDRFGIKPLYYIQTDDNFMFASEIKAIMQVCHEQRLPNERYIKTFLLSGLMDYGEETFFRSVKIFPAAHNAVFDLETNTLTLERYWNADEAAFRKKWVDGKEPEKTFEHLMQSSVELHMRTDVPLGSCLSGGVDSSLIVALASKLTDLPVRTFTGKYQEKGYNEGKYADAVSNHVNAMPFPVHTDPGDDLVEVLKRITWHQDEPSSGPGLITQLAVMRDASPHVKVLLDGQGADELFSGYISYLPTYVIELLRSKKLKKRLIALRMAFNIVLHWGGQYVPLFFSQLRSRGWRILKSKLMKKPPANTERLAAEFSDEFNERVPAGTPLPVTEKMESPLNNLCYVQLTEQSVPSLLHWEDRNSMAYSIEARVPILDYRVVEFALGLPPEYKVRGACWTKWPLRKLGDTHLPKKVAWRRSKYGYPTPFSKWLLEGSNVGQLKLVIEQFKKRGILKPETIDMYYEQHMSKKADHSWILFRYITLEIWYQIYIDDYLPHYCVT